MNSSIDNLKQDSILLFKDINSEKQIYAGGKGGTLAQLYQAGYPVPNGLVVMPTAFIDDELNPEVWKNIKIIIDKKLRTKKALKFAVRSSALAEDSTRASFAGEFKTILDVSDSTEIREAIQSVYNSRFEERVKSYSEVKGISTDHEIAVIIQEQIQAEISGVLFTADPITGNRMSMVGNFIYGQGEKLVSGEIDAEEFTFDRPKGQYKGSSALKKYSKKLFKLAKRVEKEFQCPQDIEWCVADGKLYLLQSRPITTLIGYDPVKGWNASLTGDYIWSSVNIAEATPEIMTPITWSLNEILFFETNTTITDADCLLTGNICGKPYLNLSWIASQFKTIGMDFKKSINKYEDTIGLLPPLPRFPMFPIRLRSTIKNVPANIRVELFGKKFIKKRHEYIADSPKICQNFIEKISNVPTSTELLALWNEELRPYYIHNCWTLRFVMKSVTAPTVKLRKKLIKLVGEANAITLISNFSGIEDQLASLGPLLGLSRILDEDLSKEDYMKFYGHRSPLETELYYPRPYEDPNWLDKKLEDYKFTNIDVKDLLNKRQAEYTLAWEKLKKKYSNKKVKKIQKEIDRVTQATIDREAVRSEYVRFCGVIREFLLKFAEITNLGDDVFFFTIDELLEVLQGDYSSRTYIPSRKKIYKTYKELPAYPAVIIGRFDPITWAKDPKRRNDIFDSQGTPIPDKEEQETDIIRGSAGSMGRIEGVVRVLNSPEEGHKLKPGEILVATSTNIGWSLIFPKTAAVITDVGAVLSHAAIIARELGIPAVVGAGDATMRLKTGDRVAVDGGNGIVRILSKH
jgi:pyruvate,water dikinase